MLTNATITIVETSVGSYHDYTKISETQYPAYFSQLTIQDTIKLKSSETLNKTGNYDKITALVLLMNNVANTLNPQIHLIKKDSTYYKINKIDVVPMFLTGAQIYLEEFKGVVSE
jgi:hypothetical protein